MASVIPSPFPISGDGNSPGLVSGGSDGVLEREPASLRLGVAVLPVEPGVVDELLQEQTNKSA